MKRLDINICKALGILDKVHFFDNFSKEEKELLTGFHSHFFLASAGEQIICEGARDDSFYILLTGKVSVHKKAAKRPLANLNPGECFGEISFLTRRERTTSVHALVDCIVFEIDRPTLKMMDIKVRERLKDNIIHILVRRLDHMNDLVSKLSARVA
jgi:CRP/FNR family cyclic AMP-dependent transcriptional regulator